MNSVVALLQFKLVVHISEPFYDVTACSKVLAYGEWRSGDTLSQNDALLLEGNESQGG